MKKEFPGHLRVTHLASANPCATAMPFANRKAWAGGGWHVIKPSIFDFENNQVTTAKSAA